MLKIVKIKENYFLKTDSELSISTLLEKVQCNSGMDKGSFAEKYVVKIITDLLTGAINLGEKYNKYYLEEYDAFEDYLFKKELFEKETIKKLNIQSNETLWLLRFTINNYSIKDIIGYEDENLQIINQTLEYINHEN